MTTVYFVRHAKPNFGNHDDFTRELTPEGMEDRKLVTAFLWDKNIDAVLSSPYKRAVDTVKEFADAKKLEVKVVDDFKERRVESHWIEDFESFCKSQWSDFDFKLSDGESLREVQRRNIGALLQVLDTYRGKNVAIGSHGTALSTVINYFDASFGYDEFEAIRNKMPWIVRFSFEGVQCLEIKKYDLFCGGDRK